MPPRQKTFCDNDVRGTEALRMVADFAFPQPVAGMGK
jgi:hypothetical protein